MAKKKKSSLLFQHQQTNSSSPSILDLQKRKLPWCWYCDRFFDDDKTLILHQKLKHFKCLHCARKLNSASGLVVHSAQVHKVVMEKVPNCTNGHDSPEVEIYGMEGVPKEDLERHLQGLPQLPYKRPSLLDAGPGALLPLLAAQKTAPGLIPEKMTTSSGGVSVVQATPSPPLVAGSATDIATQSPASSFPSPQAQQDNASNIKKKSEAIVSNRQVLGAYARHVAPVTIPVKKSLNK